jgi:hypothetical protein
MSKNWAFRVKFQKGLHWGPSTWDKQKKNESNIKIQVKTKATSNDNQ